MHNLEHCTGQECRAHGPQPQIRSICVLPTRPKASWDSCALKRCSHRQHLPDNARNSGGRATDRSPIQMRYFVRYMGPEWRTHAHSHRNATRACSQHAETHHGIPFHSKVCAHRNMRHLKTLGGATNPSSIKMHHIERHTGHEWCIYPHTHRITPHAYFGPAQTPPGGLICTQKVLTTYAAPPRARASLGRASNLSLIKMHHIERCTGPE